MSEILTYSGAGETPAPPGKPVQPIGPDCPDASDQQERRISFDSNDTIHHWFELTYANYATLPRSIMQAMPLEWQKRMVRCLNELDATFDWRPASGQYWCALKGPDGRFVSDRLSAYRHGGDTEYIAMIRKIPAVDDTSIPDTRDAIIANMSDIIMRRVGEVEALRAAITAALDSAEAEGIDEHRGTDEKREFWRILTEVLETVKGCG